MRVCGRGGKDRKGKEDSVPGIGERVYEEGMW